MYVYTYNQYHHQGVPTAQIPLTLFHHQSLSAIIIAWDG